ncbi:MAG TPA: PPC domain-containing protein [Allosphingosinicella sp.]|nr:PPC domain-containing protein [Allosphingosinicella sp.]
MTARKLAATVVAALGLVLAGPVLAQPAETAESIAQLEFEKPAGPWRQLIDYTPMPHDARQPERENGISLWVNEAAILPEGTMRATTSREAFALWIFHGTARAGSQAYRIDRSLYRCGEGDMSNLAHAAYTLSGQFIAAVPGSGERIPPIPHSAENEIYRAVCSDGTSARRGAAADSVAEAAQADWIGPEGPEPASELRVDLDADGLPEILRAQMRPHSMRIDVELITGRNPTRPFNIIAVEQPPTGPLVESRLRYVTPNLFLYACERQENRDVEPCRGGVANATRGAIEVITPGQPSLLIWLPDREPRIVRFPEVPPPSPPPPLPISHHDRPPVLGVGYPGVLGGACDDGTLADGRRYEDREHPLMPGQTIGVTLSSPDFEPLLHVFRKSDPDRLLAVLSGAANGRRSGLVFTAPEQGDYVFRVMGHDATAVGRWQVDLLYKEAIEAGFPGNDMHWAERPAASCS